MPFVVSKRALAACDIKVAVHGENGAPVEIDFIAQYKRSPLDQINALHDAMTNAYRERLGQPLLPVGKGQKAAEKWEYTSDVEFIKDRMTGWLGVRDGQGDAVPFSAKALDQVLKDWPELVAPLFQGFWRAHQQVREKNS